METVAVTAGFMAFLTEMFAPLLLCSSIPLGSPPVQDPALDRAAPQQCVFYVGWAGIGTPDPKSPNRAEQFLADPEIRHVRAEAARRFQCLLKSYAKPGNDVNASPLAGVIAGTPPPEYYEHVGFWSDLLVTRPCAGFIGHLTQGDNAPQAHGGFVVNLGDAADKAAAKLHRYRELAKGAIEKSTVDGHAEYRLKGDESMHLRWTLRDKYLIVAWGDESPAAIVKRMKGPEPEWLTAAGKDLPIERRAAIVRLDLEAVAAPFAKGGAAEREIAKQIRDTHLHAVTLVTGLGHDDFVSQVLVETDRVAAVLLKTMVDRPLKAEDLAVIPRDATLAMAVRVNPNLLATGVRWLVEQANESNKQSEATAKKGEVAGASDNVIDLSEIDLFVLPTIPLATAGQAIGQLGGKAKDVLDVRLCNDLAASIGDTWRLYTSPGEGSSVFNSMTGVVRVKDGQRLTKLFDRLAARKPAEKTDAKSPNAGNAEPKPWAVRKVRFADRDVYYLVRSQGESLGVLTWCLIDNELVCSLSPQNVKAYLLRQPGGSSLADEPAVVDAFRDKQPPTLMMYEDSRTMFRLTYPLMQGWAMLMAAQAGLPTDGIDPMLLPAAPTIAKYLRPAVSTVSIAPKGVQLTLHQSLPNGNLGATLYVVLCSLLPANAEAVVQQATPTVEPAQALPANNDPFPNNPATPPATPGPVCSPAAASAYGTATPPGYAPGPTYPSTSTPEAYSLPRTGRASEAPLWTPSVANALRATYPPAVPAYWAPAPGAPMTYAAPSPAPGSPVAYAPAGYVPMVVYVPMVIYVPMAFAPGGNSPAVYPPPMYAPPTYAPPASTPPAYPRPTLTPPTYAPPNAAPPANPILQAPGYAPTALPSRETNKMPEKKK